MAVNLAGVNVIPILRQMGYIKGFDGVPVQDNGTGMVHVVNIPADSAATPQQDTVNQ